MPTGSITFETCGGLTNQRISLIHGFMIAVSVERTVSPLPIYQ